MTCNFWGLGEVSLTDTTGAALSNGALLANGLYILAFSGSGYRVLGGTATYTSVTNLTANSGDAIDVFVDGTVNLRVAHGTHDTNIDSNDTWPRGKASDGTARYMLTNEFTSWIQTLMGSGLKNCRVFLSSGTYTPTSGAKKALVFLTGGGGAGGGGHGLFYAAGSGGGSGATAIHLLDLTGVSSVQITIGAGGSGTAMSGTVCRHWHLWPFSVIYGDGGDGGDSSFGAYCTAKGGHGGRGGYNQSGLGGAAGDLDTTTGNLMNNGGNPGEHARMWYLFTVPHSGNGGASFWGGAGMGLTHCWWWWDWWLGIHGQNGQDGQAPGAGGGGGGGLEYSYCFGLVAGRGGHGKAGCAVIYEF
jgi:hypothetical protein